ncbi:MAG: BatD family protein [Phyllobacterium sp.]|uniref:BatD family protein n=1 Tax=Phyllobacterium sp. TaxID=1871046 RepID=UPI0030F164BC
MRLPPWIFALFLLLAFPAKAAEPFAEASVGTKGKIVIGQQVSIDVDVYVPNFFTSPPQFPLLDIANAIVTLPDERAQNLVKSVNGEEFSGIRRTYLIIPQVAGEFTLPPATVPLGYAKVPGQSTEAVVNLPSITFAVDDLPPEAQASAFSATNAELSQTLDGDPAKLKVGDTLVRTVTLFATATRAMMLPQLQFDTPDSVKLYRQSPVLADGVSGPNREQGSQRTDRVTYMMDREGTFTLPPLVVDWFDTQSMQPQRTELKSIVLTVKAGPPTTNVIPPELPKADDDSHRLSVRAVIGISLVVLALVLLVLLVRGLLPRLRRWVDARREARAQSEHTRYRQVLTALNSGDAKTAYAALNLWTKAMGFKSATEWATTSGDKTLQTALAAFERDLFGPPHSATQGSARILTSAILAWRVRNPGRNRRSATVAPALPPLNPPVGDDWQQNARNPGL